MKKITLLFALFFNGLIHAQTFTVGDYSYEILSAENNTAQINNYLGLTKDIVIPSVINFEDESYNVVSFGSSAFENKNLINVRIPNGIITIGEFAFHNNQLTSVLIPDSVLDIEDSAFENNPNLETVVIGNGVINIGASAFTNSTPENPDLKGDLKNLTLGSSVEIIEDYAFLNNSLTNIILPKSVKSIGDDAFYNNELTSITIPENVTNLGVYAFGNNKLVNIVFSEGLKNISEGLFSRNSLTNLIIPEGITSIGENAFIGNKLTNISIPSSVTNIDDYTFLNNPLETVISKSENPASLPIFAFGFFDENESLEDDEEPSVTFDRSKIDLIIPTETSSAYSSANWVGFKSITEGIPEPTLSSRFLTPDEINIDINSNFITINLTTANAIKNAEVYNLLGQKIIDTTAYKILINSLAEGIYLLIVETNEGNYVKKFIKQQ